MSAMDIDDAEDLEMAKACFLIKKNRSLVQQRFKKLN
jgi:hypothetical protein